MNEHFHNDNIEVDKKDVDFIATLTYRTSERGGRNTPVSSSYRPQIKFGFDARQTSGQQTFIGRELVFPGDTVEAEVKMLSPKFFTNTLTEGIEFEIREGPTVIGVGKIKHIINEELRLT
jgi:translation elongation factor EF-Tu-like GTPase